MENKFNIYRNINKIEFNFPLQAAAAFAGDFN